MKKIILGFALFSSISALAESPDLKCGKMLIPGELLSNLMVPTCIANKSIHLGTENKITDQSYVSGGGVEGGLEIRVFEDNHSSFPGHESESIKQIGRLSSADTTASTVPAYAFRQVCGLSLFTAKILSQDEGVIFFDTNTVLKVKLSSKEIRTIYSDYNSNAGHTCIGHEPSIDAYDTKIAKLVAALNDTVFYSAGIQTKDIFNASIYKKMGLQIHQMGWKNGYTCEELISGGFNVWDIKLFRTGPESGFYNFSYRDFTTLVDFGCPRSFIMNELSSAQKRWLYNPNEPKSHGLKEWKALGLTISDLQDVMDETKDASRPFQWTCTDLKDAGYTFKEISQFKHTAPWGESWDAFSDIDLKNAGFKAKDFLSNGLTLRELRINKTFSGKDLVQEGFSCGDLKNAGYGLFQRKGCSP